jgi:Sulfotransferase family
MSDYDASHNKGPIFIVGSPRSGTSILTWCLGQHANIFPQEESGWLGEFAVSVGVHHKAGYMRGDRSQLSALDIDRAEFFKTIGDGINEMILRHRPQLEQKSRLTAKQNPAQAHTAFNVSKSDVEPKSRWVDGTPEYSLYICALKKLFPDAKFVHIVRDVRSVVDSMLNFRPDGKGALVKTEQEAYEYWTRTVEACLGAELALGKRAIYRLRYDDLVQQPAMALHGVLEFLDEPFMPACIEPVPYRINSSNVPVDFCATECGTDIHVIERSFIVGPPTKQALVDFESTFDKRIAFMAGLDAEYDSIQKEMLRLQAIGKKSVHGLNWCGVALAVNMAVALIVSLKEIFLPGTVTMKSHLLWLIFATAGASMYVAIRRTGFRNLYTQVIRRVTANRAHSRHAITK